MRVGYARVSTDDQSLDLQIDALKAAGCERIFEEKASGGSKVRPELIKALDFLRSGDVLVVWKLDRLARSMAQLVETITDIEGRGIAFVSVTEKIETETPAGKLLFHIIAALAEFERGLIRERTNAGLVAARKRGKVGGRPKALSSADVAAANAMLKSGAKSVREVADLFGVAVSTLFRYLAELKQEAVSVDQVGLDDR